MLETRAAYVEANGFTREEWIQAKAHSFGPLGSTLARWRTGASTTAASAG